MSDLIFAAVNVRKVTTVEFETGVKRKFIISGEREDSKNKRKGGE